MRFRNLNSAYHFSFFVIVLLLVVIRLYEFPSDPAADCEYRCSSMARAMESTRRRRRSLHAYVVSMVLFHLWHFATFGINFATSRVQPDVLHGSFATLDSVEYPLWSLESGGPVALSHGAGQRKVNLIHILLSNL
jgi:nitric oxide reductase large subunit